MNRAVRAELRAIYRAVPEVHCKGLCSGACGPICLTRLEQRRLEAAAGRRLEAVDAGLSCSMLNPDGRCAGYEARPLICRVYGAVERMRCPHGCAPAKMLTDTQVHELLVRMEAIGGGVIHTFDGDLVKLAGARISR